jgi:hypothetical protein
MMPKANKKEREREERQHVRKNQKTYKSHQQQK